MSGSILLLVILAVLAAATYVVFGRQQGAGYEQDERSRMPAEIATAKLLMSEQKLMSDGLVPLVARVDQVFRTSDGRLIPVETKTRRQARWFPFDQVELSVQATILRHRGAAVAEYGYVRAKLAEGGVRYLKVPLLPDETIFDLARRRQALMAGRAHPRGASTPAQCRNCGHRARCQVRP